MRRQRGKNADANKKIAQSLRVSFDCNLHLCYYFRMKGLIITNPYDVNLSQRRKTRRMESELYNLGVFVEVVPNDRFLAYVDGGEVKCDLNVDFALYFDKDKYVAQMLEAQGIRVFNSARATEICDDKMLTHITLANCGIPMPTTLASPLCYNASGKITYDYLKRAEEILGFPMVVKECYGSYGKQVYLARTREELRDIVERIKLKPYVLQRFVSDSAGRDMRVIVIGGKTVCGMIRQSKTDFRSNAELGATATACDVPEEIANLCERAAKVIGLDYCGIDVLLGDRPQICEVNSNAMFSAMEQATNVNVARKYGEHIVRVIKNR